MSSTTKEIVNIGTDKAFVLRDKRGEIKAFKTELVLSNKDGTLVQPIYGGDFVISAQGYEAWAEKAGASVILPKMVAVGSELKQNPFVEKNAEGAIIAVHARAIAFRYSSIGIPQVCAWTTILDTPAYRMLDLLAKAKKIPQAFKLLPSELRPGDGKNETWASYPFDSSTNLWINTSHADALNWYSTIINREKKAVDFAQTFARRNAYKHLSGRQKSPGPEWKMEVLSWRATGENIIKWDAAQYASLQDTVEGIVEGDKDFASKIELKKGSENVLNVDEIDIETENQVDEQVDYKPEQEQTENYPEQAEKEFTKSVQQIISLKQNFPDEFEEFCPAFDPSKMSDQEAKKMYKNFNAYIDGSNQEE